VFTVRYEVWISEALIQSRYTPHEICGRQSEFGRSLFSTSTAVVLSATSYQVLVLFPIVILPLT